MCVLYSSALKCHSPSPIAHLRWSINPRECGAYFIVTSISHPMRTRGRKGNDGRLRFIIVNNAHWGLFFRSHRFAHIARKVQKTCRPFRMVSVPGWKKLVPCLHPAATATVYNIVEAATLYYSLPNTLLTV